jgi:polygalacturonase
MQYLVKISTTILSFVFFAAAVNAQSSANKLELAAVYDNIEFSMPQVKGTSFPAYEVNISQFGAIGDGIYKNTIAITKAIADVSQKGGGKVIISSGIWLTGPITLKSNINLQLNSGAILLFSRDFDDYSLQETSFEGLNSFRCVSPINAKGANNIAITGDGVIDGNGDAWRPVKKSKMLENQWNNIVSSGGFLSKDGKTWFPSEGSKKGFDDKTNDDVTIVKNEEYYNSIKDFLRPVMVSLVECTKVLLDGPTFQNSPAWNIHPLMCEDIIIRNLSVKNPWYSQNGDGLDLESCKNALIYNNAFDVGDDAICIKSGKDKDGRDRNFPTENVIIKNNVVYHGHGGFVVGSEMSSGVKNVHVSNCTFIGTDTGLRFKSTRGRGGIVDNIYISNIQMTNIATDAIRFNLFYAGSNSNIGDKQFPITEETPSFRNIFMENITVLGANQAASFTGLPEMNLKNIHLKNSILKAEHGIEIVNADGMHFTNVKIITPTSDVIRINNGKNLKFKSISFAEIIDPKVHILGGKTKNIYFSKKDFKVPSKQVIFGENISQSEIIFE